MPESGLRPCAGQRDVQHGVQSAGGAGQPAHSPENRSPAEHCQRPQNRAGLRKRNQQPEETESFKYHTMFVVGFFGF